MASDQAKVRVVIDTSQAKADLAALTKVGERSGGAIGSRIRKSIISGMGFGVGVAAAKAALTGPTSSGIGDVFGEAFGAWGAQLDNWVFGDMGPEARASRRAREESIAGFGFQAGMAGAVPPGAKEHYNQLKSFYTNEEKGRKLFEMDKDFRSTDPGELIERIMSKVSEVLFKVADYLAEKLNPFDGK